MKITAVITLTLTIGVLPHNPIILPRTLVPVGREV